MRCVVNLGGFVLIRFAPLLEQAGAARLLLMALGLGTAVLAGMVMLTRISIKVRLAWSTVAQMGFMLLECALGLYSLAALHLIRPFALQGACVPVGVLRGAPDPPS